MVALSLFVFAGCSEINDLKDEVEGLTNAIVIEGILLGVEAPTDPRIDLAGTDFDQGAATAVMLADAADVSDLSNAPVEGAAVGMLLAKNGRVSLAEEGDGTYSADASAGLVYEEGDEATASAEFGGATSSIAMRLPRTPTIDVPEQIEPGRDVTIDLSGQGFDNALVTVIKADSGEVTFTNYPDSIQEMYDLTHGDGAQSIVVPGQAVQQEALFILAVAGLKNADASTVQNANTALSAFIAGSASFKIVSSLPPG